MLPRNDHRQAEVENDSDDVETLTINKPLASRPTATNSGQDSISRSTLCCRSVDAQPLLSGDRLLYIKEQLFILRCYDNQFWAAAMIAVQAAMRLFQSIIPSSLSVLRLYLLPTMTDLTHNSHSSSCSSSCATANDSAICPLRTRFSRRDHRLSATVAV